MCYHFQAMSRHPRFISLGKFLGMCWLCLVCLSVSLRAAEVTCTVAADGSGNYKTIQEALAAVPHGRTERTVIRLRAGTYEGPVVISVQDGPISLKGEEPQTTIIDWNRNVKDLIPEGADRTNPGVHVLAADFHSENVTFRNSSGDHGQGLAMRVDGDRAVFWKCRFLGWQDTLMVNKGRDYFKDCYLEGRVDFIYGDGTAFFDHCEIHSKNGGYVTAASTPADHAYGFVFVHCKLTGDDIPWVDPSGQTTQKVWKLPNTNLGRPWRPYASVTFMECEMGSHIVPAGWNNWGKTENEATARYAEFDNSGPGAAPEPRVPWAKRLTKEDAAGITAQSVLGGQDKWSPEKDLANK